MALLGFAHHLASTSSAAEAFPRTLFVLRRPCPRTLEDVLLDISQLLNFVQCIPAIGRAIPIRLRRIAGSSSEAVLRAAKGSAEG